VRSCCIEHMSWYGSPPMLEVARNKTVSKRLSQQAGPLNTDFFFVYLAAIFRGQSPLPRSVIPPSRLTRSEKGRHALPSASTTAASPPLQRPSLSSDADTPPLLCVRLMATSSSCTSVEGAAAAVPAPTFKSSFKSCTEHLLGERGGGESRLFQPGTGGCFERALVCTPRACSRCDKLKRIGRMHCIGTKKSPRQSPPCTLAQHPHPKQYRAHPGLCVCVMFWSAGAAALHTTARKQAAPCAPWLVLVRDEGAQEQRHLQRVLPRDEVGAILGWIKWGSEGGTGRAEFQEWSA